MRARRHLAVLLLSCVALLTGSTSLSQAFVASSSGPKFIPIALARCVFAASREFGGMNVLFPAYQAVAFLWGLLVLLAGIGMLLGKNVARTLYIELLISAIVINLVLFRSVDIVGIAYAVIAIYFLSRRKVLEFFADRQPPPAEAQV